MSRSLRPPALLTFFAFAAALAGCAGSSVNKVEVSTELPKDLKDKFEIRDETAPKPAPSPLPVSEKPPGSDHSSRKQSSTRKGRGKKAPRAKRGDSSAPSSSATAAFSYPNRRPAKDPIWVGEKGTYDITYFGMSAGDFTLEVMPYKVVNERKVYHILGTAISSKVFNLFYRLNDTVETFIDYDGLFSHRFHLLLDETKQSRDDLELYDSEKKQTFYWNKWNHKERGYSETKTYQEITPFSQDSLSALYYLRVVPLPTGAVFSFPVVSEGNSWEAVVTVVRREMMDTPMGRVQCVVVKPQTKFRGVLQQNKGDSFIWLTDDDRRFVVRLEAKVRIGTVVARLKKLEPGVAPTAAAGESPGAASSPNPSPSPSPSVEK